ncbi:MAG: hypothetical protein ACRDQX_15895 [Pseudonocardiaceae bacterium]
MSSRTVTTWTLKIRDGSGIGAGAGSSASSPARPPDAFGVPLHHGGPVSAILAINHDGTGLRSRWQQIGRQRASAAVTAGYLAEWFIDEPHEHHRITLRRRRYPPFTAGWMRRIASTVPVIELSVGTDTPQALRIMLADLSEAPDQAEPAR